MTATNIFYNFVSFRYSPALSDRLEITRMRSPGDYKQNSRTSTECPQRRKAADLKNRALHTKSAVIRFEEPRKENRINVRFCG